MSQANSEKERLRTLWTYDILDSGPEASFDRLASLAARICATPIATVTLVDAERQWFKARIGLEVSQTSRSVAFCDHTVRGPCLHVVADALTDERFAANPLVTGPPYIRFYAGAPLVAPSGQVLGALCVMDHVPRELTTDQHEILCSLAEQVVLLMEARVQSRRLETVLEQARQEAAEREQAQQQVQALADRLTTTLESITDAFYTLDRDWCFTYVNHEAERVLSRDRSSLLGRNVWTEFPEAVDAPFHAAYHRAIKSGAAEHLEFFYPPLDTWFEMHVFPSSEGLAVYFSDVTQRRHDDEAMRRLRSELEVSNAELRQFAFVASHDLREPLRKVRVFGGRLMEQWDRMDAAGRADYLRRMSDAAERMDRLLDALLGYSRVTMQSAGPEPIPLSDLIDAVRHDLELQLESTGAEVVVEGTLPLIHGEREQMRQMLLNLISNALKFRHPERAPKVVVRAVPVAAVTGRVSLEVEDNGRGFAPEVAERIFEPFIRVGEDASVAGSGMGLAIVRSVVARHGGAVSAVGKPGSGAVFRIELPCA